MEFWNLYRIVRKRLWMVLFLVVVTLGFTMYSVMSRPHIYKAVATMRVAITSPAVSDIGRLDWYTAGMLFSSLQETILSRSILQEVVAQNQLGMTPDELRSGMGVSRVGNSNLLRIEVKSTEPEMAKRLANDVAVAFIRSNQKLLDSQNASSVSFYEEQVKQAEQNYERARDDFRDSLNQPNARAAENRFITAQAAYQAAQDKLEGVRLINRFPDLRPSSVAMDEPAVTPTEPEGRQASRYALIALLVSLIFGVFLALAIEYLDYSIKSPHEVTADLGLAVVGTIPHFRRGVSAVAHVLSNLELPVLSPALRWRMGRLESRRLPADELPPDSAEAFRTARVNLAVAHRRRQREGITGASQLLIASSRPRDGKTTVTAQLGIALARAGHRVILVDGDLRKPELHLHCGSPPSETGLVQVLQGVATPAQATQDTAYPKLSMLSVGEYDRSLAELLDTEQFSELLDTLGHDYDFVLVDSPALGIYPDAAVLASRLGRAVLVVDATRPSSDNELRSLGLLRRSGATGEGVILNKISPEYVNPMKLRGLPPHIIDLSDTFLGNGHANGHTNGHTNGNGTDGHAQPANWNGLGRG